MNSFTFSLRFLLVLTAIISFLFALVHEYGFWLVLGYVFVPLLAALIWYLAVRLAPTPTIYATVIGFLLFPLSVVLVTSLLHSHEDARQHQAIDNMMNKSREWLIDKELHPDRRPPICW